MPTPVDVAGVLRLVADGAQLVEVLDRSEYEREHLPGATNIPLRELDERGRAELDPARAVVAYCFDYQ